MKKLIITCEIVIVVVVLAKIIAMGGIMKNSETIEHCLSVNHAFAGSQNEVKESPRIKDVFEDRLSEERELMSSLLRKQKELNAREDHLKNEERNLGVLKTEIIARIDELKEIEGRITVLVESIKEVDDQKYKDLAKIYESFPPSHAGVMLEKLDKETAAAIIMNMKSKKAGAVWEHMSPEKAVEITEEITNIQLSAAAKNEQ